MPSWRQLMWSIFFFVMVATADIGNIIGECHFPIPKHIITCQNYNYLPYLAPTCTPLEEKQDRQQGKLQIATLCDTCGQKSGDGIKV